MISLLEHLRLPDRYLKNTTVWLNLCVSLGLNLALWLLVISRAQAGAVIPLHSTIYFGIDRIGPWYQLLLLPGFGAATVLLNFLFGATQYRSFRALTYVLVWFTSVLQLLLLLGVYLVVQLV